MSKKTRRKTRRKTFQVGDIIAYKKIKKRKMRPSAGSKLFVVTSTTSLEEYGTIEAICLLSPYLKNGIGQEFVLLEDEMRAATKLEKQKIKLIPEYLGHILYEPIIGLFDKKYRLKKLVFSGNVICNKRDIPSWILNEIE
jgi:hypothetical protein